jgi:hypothetical protein
VQRITIEADRNTPPGTGARRIRARRRIEENVEMGDRRLRSEIRDEQERIISAVRSARDHWEMAKAEDSFADLLERMADELRMGSAHDRGRFLAAAQALRQSAAVNEHRYVTALSSADDPYPG